ncbi:aminotransferase class V-fold PLP-dependent enzyme [Demequina lutea]|nr:aminotransferase class V-fold PLP-dependent enzyme [Demequina lutea]
MSGLEGVRELFPITQELVYLDNAHQAPLSSLVRRELDRFYDDAEWRAGPKEKWAIRVEEVRVALAAFLGTTPDTIAFTKNTSEGVNIAATTLPWRPGDNVVLMAGEHANLAYGWMHQRRNGLEVRVVPAASEGADGETFRPVVDAQTRAVAVSHVAYDTGQRNDIASIGRLCADRGIPLVVDAMQSVGVFPVEAEGVDWLAAGCHKGLLTPHGLGFVHRAPRFAELVPTYVAAASIEGSPHDPEVSFDTEIALSLTARRLEIGNLNYAAIHALGASLDLIGQVGLATITERVLALGDYLDGELAPLGVEPIGPTRRDRRSHIRVLDLPGTGWQDYLADRAIRVTEVRDRVRVSFGLFTAEEDIDALVRAIGDRLRHGALGN